MSTAHERRNREFWDADADDYQAVHGTQLRRGAIWGVWAIPEAELQVLGDVRGLDVLEYGCGGAQWSIALGRAGARPIALDISRAQLRHAATAVQSDDVDVQLVCASGENVPLRDASFDVVFCDHGAMSFCEPSRSLQEVSRLLRPGGLLVFNKATILHSMCWDERKERQGRRLRLPYFRSHADERGQGTVDFQLPYGEWIRLFHANGFEIEDLLELEPPKNARTTYGAYASRSWAKRWPSEEIWKLRKA